MYNIISQGGKQTAYHMSLQIDTLAEIADLPHLDTAAAGSDCICLEDSSVWMLGNDDEWHEL